MTGLEQTEDKETNGTLQQPLVDEEENTHKL